MADCMGFYLSLVQVLGLEPGGKKRKNTGSLFSEQTVTVSFGFNELKPM